MIQNIVRFVPAALSLALLAACGGKTEQAPVAGTPVAQQSPVSLPQVVAPEGAVLIESMESVAGSVPLRIANGQVIQGTLRISRDGSVPVAGVQIGNYRNQSDGNLFLKLCKAENCVESEASVVGSKDNAYLLFNLQPAISVTTGDEFRFEIHRGEGTRMPLALRTYDATNDAKAVLAAEGDAAPRAVRIALYYTSP